jgi:hypothetical protein
MSRAIYLAAPYSLKEYLAKEIEPKLLGWGHAVTSRWIHEPPDYDGISVYMKARRADAAHPRNPVFDEIMRETAETDVVDVQNADMLIRFPAADATRPSSGGKFVETGLAVALGLEIVIIGTRECVFDYLPFVKVYSDFEVACDSLGLTA